MDENGKIRILFVDDEDNVLRALKRALRGMRDEWDMHFLSGGGPGLELLEEESFDMVISDMYMTDMSGADFLRTVKNRYPGTIRVILSAHSDYELILKT